MIRKIIKQAGQAYTITLPIEWVRANGIDKKEEVELNLNGKTIVISSDNPTKGGIAKINLDEVESRRIIYQNINALYAKGYDEIEITCKRDITNEINKSMQNLLGYALVSREREKYIIKDVGGGNYSELDEIFKRVFQIILLFYQDSISNILEDKGNEEELRIRDLEVNKFCLFLQRAINKSYYQDTINARILFTYSIALEEISDEIHRLCRTNIQQKPKKDKEIKEIMELCQKGLEEAFDIYYRFNEKRIENLYKIRDRIRDLVLKSKSPILTRHLVKIIEEVADLSHLNLMLKM